MRIFKRLLLGGLVLALCVVVGFRLAAGLRESQALNAMVPEAGRLIDTTMGRIYVEEAGPRDGPVLLFAHGTAAWSGLWRPTLAEMGARGWRAVAFDMPPFGFSDHAPDGDYRRQVQAQRILALIEALETRPVLVAHSVGAGPGVEAVMLAPEAFAGLVVVDGAIGLNGHERGGSLPFILRGRVLREAAVALTMTNPLLTGRFLRGLIHVKEAAKPDVVTILTRPFAREGTTRAYAQWLPSLLVPPVGARSTRPEAYRALEVPTVYIWGTEDTVTPLSQGQELTALTPGAQLITLPGVGHIPQIEDRAAFSLALSRALGLIAPDVAK